MWEESSRYLEHEYKTPSNKRPEHNQWQGKGEHDLSAKRVDCHQDSRDNVAEMITVETNKGRLPL